MNTLEMAVKIVSERAGATALSADEVMKEVTRVYTYLEDLASKDVEQLKEKVAADIEASAKRSAPVSGLQSIGEDEITCLECGQKMRALTALHLAMHNLTPTEYRKKYGIPRRVPLTARAVTLLRSEKAKQRGIPENLRLYLDSRRRRKQLDEPEETE